MDTINLRQKFLIINNSFNSLLKIIFLNILQFFGFDHLSCAFFLNNIVKINYPTNIYSYFKPELSLSNFLFTFSA